MRSPIRRMGRHHTVVAAYLALFSALGGTAYAVDTITSADIVDETIEAQDIAPGAVDGAEIHNAAVTGSKLGLDAVNSSKVKYGSLFGSDLADDSLTGKDLDIEVETVYANTDQPDPLNPKAKQGSVSCPPGYTTLGGGGDIHLEIGTSQLSQFEQEFVLVESSPKFPPYGGEVIGWTARAVASRWEYRDSFGVTVWARCAAL
jgi:hypothetical protein